MGYSYCLSFLCTIIIDQKGTDGAAKTEEFLKKFQRGGGMLICNPKKYNADFGPLKRDF